MVPLPQPGSTTNILKIRSEPPILAENRECGITETTRARWEPAGGGGGSAHGTPTTPKHPTTVKKVGQRSGGEAGALGVEEEGGRGGAGCFSVSFFIFVCFFWHSCHSPFEKCIKAIARLAGLDVGTQSRDRHPKLGAVDACRGGSGMRPRRHLIIKARRRARARRQKPVMRPSGRPRCGAKQALVCGDALRLLSLLILVLVLFTLCAS